MTVRLTEEQKIKILNGRDLYRIMQAVLKREKKIDRGKEHVWVVALAMSNRILNIELVGLGSPKAVVVEPVDVFSFALNKQAAKVILVHNHPSGELKPSVEDIAITEQMLAIGKFLDCRMIDHLIISEQTFYSFQEAGLLDELESNAVDLTFAQVKRLEEQLALSRQQQQRLREELEAKTGELEQKEKQHAEELLKAKMDMARVLLQQGIETEKVMQLTGLTEEQMSSGV